MTKKFLLAAMVIAALTIVGCSDDDDTTSESKKDTEQTEPEPEPEPEVTSWGSFTPSGEGAYVDGELVLTFNATPTLGTSGKITIYNASGTQVDYIDMADDVASEIEDREAMTAETICNTSMDILYAAPASARYRVVYYKAVEVSGKTVTIRPHFGVLDFDTDYYVTIDASAISATDFEGIGAKEWEFSTKSAPSSNTSLSVAKSGTADFRTVQRALNYCCKAGQTADVTINVANGTYEEQLYLRSKNNVTIKGASRDGVIIQASNSQAVSASTGSAATSKPAYGSAIGTIGGRPAMLFESCSGLRFEDMTLKNTWSSERSQAEVIYFNNDSGTLAFVNCTLSSRQDTIETKGYNWFYNCLVEGNVDYVWGTAVCCLLEDCEICSIKDLTDTKGTVYIVQARTNKSTDPGYVFLNCDLTNTVGGSDVYLARSGGNTDYYDNVAYINCNMTNSALNSAGWYSSPAPQPSTASATSGWKYYGVEGVSTSSWVYSYELTESEYSQYYKDRATIFTTAGLTDQSWLVE